MSRCLLGLLITVCPALGFALGLGDIHLKSALGEPLMAQIELQSATPEELRGVQAGLASRETFERYGVESSQQLSNLQFRVVQSGTGASVLQVSTAQAIVDPFLTFILEVTWPRGRLLREYTLLLDPPVYLPGEAQSSAPVAAPQTGVTQSGAVQRSAQPQPAENAAPAPEAVVPRPAAAQTPRPQSPDGGAVYTVRRNDTLWQIASQYASGGPREVNRTMVALFRNNPQAFDGNINDLRAGAILRVPASAEVSTISSAEAMAEVRRQYAQWREQRGSAGAEAPQDESARLRLVTPTERSEGAASAASEGSPAAGADERVRQLEQQLAESRRMLELKDAELAQLQERLGGSAAPVPSAERTPPTAQAEPSATQEPVEPLPESAEPPPVAAEPEAAPAPPPAAAGEQPAPSLLDWMIQNWYFPVGALLLLGALIFAFLRRREESDFDELGRIAQSHAEGPARDEPVLEQVPAASSKLRSLKREDNFLVEESGVHEQPAAIKSPPAVPPAAEVFGEEEKPRAQKSSDDTLSSETAINLDQGDPLAEADFHMAYGLYDQAADLVRIGIERAPKRRDLKLKLIEIYFVWGNKDAFLQTARALRASGDVAAAGEWDKIAIMGRQIAPEDPMFAGAAGSGAGADVDLNLEGGENRVDLDVSPPVAGGDSIDFMLDDTPEPGAEDPNAVTRDMAARTVETPTMEMQGPDTPTVESPALGGKTSSTIREKIDSAHFRKGMSADQTAELAIDDLGLDVGALEALEQTDHARNHTIDDMEETQHPDDGATLLTGMDEPARDALRGADRDHKKKEEAESDGIEDPDRTMATSPATGTWILDDDESPTTTSADFNSREQTAERPKARDIDATAETRKIPSDDMDLDLDSLEAALASDTAKQPRRGSSEEEQFSTEVFGHDQDLTSTDTAIDLDVSEARRDHDSGPTATQRISAEDMDFPELEAVTMSEVGTKLDLARAYMDMGDPEGARNILDEVLQEGSGTQKQEAQRLLDSLPG